MVRASLAGQLQLIIFQKCAENDANLRKATSYVTSHRCVSAQWVMTFRIFIIFMVTNEKHTLIDHLLTIIHDIPTQSDPTCCGVKVGQLFPEQQSGHRQQDGTCPLSASGCGKTISGSDERQTWLTGADSFHRAQTLPTCSSSSGPCCLRRCRGQERRTDCLRVGNCSRDHARVSLSSLQDARPVEERDASSSRASAEMSSPSSRRNSCRGGACGGRASSSESSHVRRRTSSCSGPAGDDFSGSLSQPMLAITLRFLLAIDLWLSKRLGVCACEESPWGGIRPLVRLVEFSGHAVPWLVGTVHTLLRGESAAEQEVMLNLALGEYGRVRVAKPWPAHDYLLAVEAKARLKIKFA